MSDARAPVHSSVAGRAWLSLKSMGAAWTWKMAWRDSRRSRRRLLLYSASIVLGVAALIAIGSLGANLTDSIETQAKSLLGADLVLASRDEPSPEALAFIASLGGTQAHEISFSSMILFPKTDHTRLVQIRALEGDFPFYGSFETDPPGAARTFRSQGGALIEESLVKQFGVRVGDPVKIGTNAFRITGSLQKVPGETVAFGSIAPRVYIPLKELPKTGLLQKESLVRHRVYFRFEPEVNVTELVKRIRPQTERFHLEVDTVEHRKQDLGRAMTNLYHFLNLVGFIALLLGGIGIASAIHVHVRQKLPTVAVLKSIGCRSDQAFAIYLAQAIGLGLVGVTAGLLLGLAVQIGLPSVLGDFLPVRIATRLSGWAVARGAGVGLGLCLLFALLPLLSVRRIPPLAVLRSFCEPVGSARRDPLIWLCSGAIALALVAFSISQSRRWTLGLAFAGGLALSFAILTALAKALMALVKGQIGRVPSFTWRQGLASLYRPHNRTVLLLVSLGLGTFLILTLYLLQINLVRNIVPSGLNSRPDTVLFDVQSDQKDGVIHLLQTDHLPVLEEVPIVTMRLSAVKGRAVEQVRKDPQRGRPNWALRREYRSTYRDHLVDSERLVGGAWHERVPKDTSPIPVSLEDGIAKTLQVSLGDELEFDVQGVVIKTVVASLREVDWHRMQPNFFVVFPLGVLEDAPSFHVVTTRVGSSDKGAELQRQLVKQFPNVSTIDLSLVLQTLDSILRKITFVVRFMASFTVGTGLLVLAASILTGRYQRLQESVLLRTLGASRRQVWQVLLVEYLALGGLAALTGVLLAVAASWALAQFVFHIQYGVGAEPLLVAIALVAMLTVLTGLLASRGVCTHPPMEVLRNEV